MNVMTALAVAPTRHDRTLFGASLALGLTLAAVIYLGLFNQLSETKLVMLSPVWFFPAIFGMYGLLARMTWMPEGYVEAKAPAQETRGGRIFGKIIGGVFRVLPPIVSLPLLLVLVIALAPLLFLKKERTPLQVATVGTTCWIPLLVIFFGAVFPSL